MQELTKVFNDIVLPIEVINENEFMVNVSGVAKKHGKNITDWKDSKGIKEYLSALEKSNGLKGNLIDTSIVGKTMIHNKLLIVFARFISAEFAVWCDNTIYEILTGAKDAEIKRLHAERKLCILDDEGYTSVRGISQRTEYTEKQIREFAEKLNLIEQDVRDTLYWKVNKTKNGLVKSDKEYSTPYFKLERMENLLDQFYKGGE